MDLSRQEYPTLLVREIKIHSLRSLPCSFSTKASLVPAQAVNILNERVRLIASVNTSIADWLQVGPLQGVRRDQCQLTVWQERRKVEEAYIQGLTKLAKRPTFQDGSASLGFVKPCAPGSVD